MVENYNKTIKKSKRSKNGGKAIDSGGYGCIFYPQLTCKNKKHRKNYVSKLMLKKDGQTESANIQNIKKILQTIPNAKDKYLIASTFDCIPDNLSSSDLVNYQKQCKSLQKNNITANNINQNLNKLMAINMPYAGKRLDTWLTESPMTSEKMVYFNKQIVYLLKKVIIPMNKKNVLHNDLKDDNIMIHQGRNIVIDWGLATLQNDASIPDLIKERPLQFNVPFSCLLFHNKFESKYIQFLKEQNKEDNIILAPFNIRMFLLNEYFRKQEEYYGQSEANTSLYNILYYDVNKDKKHYFVDKGYDDEKMVIEFTTYLNLVIEYIIPILQQYSDLKQNKVELYKYFNEIYKYNSDIWGLLSCYFRLFNRGSKGVIWKCKHKKEIMILLKNMIINDVCKNGNKKIQVHKIIKTIQKINHLLTNKTMKNEKKIKKLKRKTKRQKK